jgi:segregation and condensation protein A
MNVIDFRDTYNVTTPVYEGPLDLLLQLIERAELDITKLALAQITDQYLEYIKDLPELSPDQVSEFLVIAARLLQIKSEALLPRPPTRLPGEEDPGEALARQLILYRRYKKIAEILGSRQQNRLRTFVRTAPTPYVGRRVELSGVNLQDLVISAQSLRGRVQQPMLPLDQVVAMPRITIRQKLRAIVQILNQKKIAYFKSLIDKTSSRIEIVVTFLAVLELIRLHLVKVSQEGLFSDFNIEADGLWQGEDDLELEFGE